MVAPAAAMDFIHFALSDPKTTTWQNGWAIAQIATCWTACRKWTVSSRSLPRENDDVISVLYGATNADFPQLEDFLGVSQITAPDEFFHWQARKNYLPLVTAGQQPVFMDDRHSLPTLFQPGFDAGKIVILPPEAKLLVTATNQTEVRVLNSKFMTQRVDIEVEASLLGARHRGANLVP